MKWSEVRGVSEKSILVRHGSGRKAWLIEKFDIVQKISVRYLDNGEFEEREDPANFRKLAPPVGTVPRTST